MPFISKILMGISLLILLFLAVIVAVGMWAGRRHKMTTTDFEAFFKNLPPPPEEDTIKPSPETIPRLILLLPGVALLVLWISNPSMASFERMVKSSSQYQAVEQVRRMAPLHAKTRRYAVPFIENEFKAKYDKASKPLVIHYKSYRIFSKASATGPVDINSVGYLWSWMPCTP